VIREAVQTPLGVIDLNTFYAERDSRTVIGGASPTDFPIAVVLPPDQAASPTAHTALLWACSMTRRMGRAFAHTIIVAPSATLDHPFLGFPRMGEKLTLRQALEYELFGADPFGGLEFREPTEGALYGTRLGLHIGGPTRLDTLTSLSEGVVVRASGWVASVSSLTEATCLSTAPLNAAAPAAVLAAALGVAEVYRSVHAGVLQGPETPQTPLWMAMDTGDVTAEAMAGETWLLRGGARPNVVPWKRETEEQITKVRNLLLVSAGGLGYNLMHILPESHLEVEKVVVIDPDKLDLSNLNRLVGAHVSDLGQNKAALAARPFARRGIDVTPVDTTYERWRADNDPSRHQSAGDVVLVGVDQVQTRLEVAADWPALLVNGATSGWGWVVSAHRPNLNGCLGCFYGSARQSYNERHQVVACGGVGGGVTTGPPTPGPMASYPHVSVTAAAMMSAVLMHALWDVSGDIGTLAGHVREASTLRSRFARTRTQQRVNVCSLLCSEPYLQSFFASREFGPTEVT
jgi:molybdopterin/thiamine biosynthesis adenylyltransferase